MHPRQRATASTPSSDTAMDPSSGVWRSDETESKAVNDSTMQQGSPNARLLPKDPPSGRQSYGEEGAVNATTSEDALVDEPLLNENEKSRLRYRTLAALAEYGRSLEKPQSGDMAEPATRNAWVRVTSYAILACLGSTLFGYEISVISGAKEEFRDEFNLDKTSFLYGLVASSMTIGAMLGTATAGFVQDEFGRKCAVLCASFIYTTGAVLEGTAVQLSMLICGRVIVGVGVGWFSSTIPLYIAELAPSKIRGKLVTLNQFSVCIGILLGYIVNYTVQSWRFELSGGIIIAALLGFSFLVLTPESPRWLVSRHKIDKAFNVLKLVRQSSDASCEAELALIAATHEENANIRVLAKLKQPAVFRSLLIGIGLSASQQLTGVNAVNFFAQEVLQNAGMVQGKAFLMAIFIGVVKVVMVGIAMLIMDKVGRKTLLLVGLAGMILTVYTLATVTVMTGDEGQVSAMTASVSLLLYMGFYEIGLGPVVWLLLSEIYPLSVRGVAMSIGATANWIFSFVTGLMFPVLKGWIQQSGVFYVYGSIAVAATAFIYFFVPETKGLSMEEIEAVFVNRNDSAVGNKKQRQEE
eukprot:gb/GECG01010916.1/.p1 GENE.gb/GECG01010916.1/~~gb/GECG01010916.1/.p1  ORF type:complete len:581 (+),score=68.58 gb/GECG01010916.1/:1-1743(+)